MIGIVLAALPVVIGAAGWGASYNRLITARQEVADAWAAIDVELDRRRALIPGLVEAVTSSAAHERVLIDRLVSARAAATAAAPTAAQRSGPEQELAMAAEAVVALRERYPALNTQQNFLRLQHELATTEDRISAARRYYNIRVADWNRRLQAVPSNVVASRHGMRPVEFFDV